MGNSIFKGLKDAIGGSGGRYFMPGVYKVKIKRVFQMVSRKKKDLVIIEAEVLESDVPARPKGSAWSQCLNFSDHDAALANYKQFICAAFGVDADDEEAVEAFDKKFAKEGGIAGLGERACEEKGPDANPLAGYVMPLVCANVTTRAGGDFTTHQWGLAEE
jgi:hypothetical protein